MSTLDTWEVSSPESSSAAITPPVADAVMVPVMTVPKPAIVEGGRYREDRPVHGLGRLPS